MYWSICGGVVIIVLGIFVYLKPNLIWKLTEQWKSYSADEASDLYIKNTKLSGVLFALFGIVMIVLPLIMK
ncbi:MAG: hypothetical protein RR764_05200 [Oscillospiraceae bacterium]